MRKTALILFIVLMAALLFTSCTERSAFETAESILDKTDMYKEEYTDEQKDEFETSVTRIDIKDSVERFIHYRNGVRYAYLIEFSSTEKALEFFNHLKLDSDSKTFCENIVVYGISEEISKIFQ